MQLYMIENIVIFVAAAIGIVSLVRMQYVVHKMRLEIDGIERVLDYLATRSTFDSFGDDSFYEEEYFPLIEEDDAGNEKY